MLFAAPQTWIPAPWLKWFEQGVECQVLKTEGGGWQKGKVRFCLQFIPEEPIENNSSNPVILDSPLDDLRRSLGID